MKRLAKSLARSNRARVPAWAACAAACLCGASTSSMAADAAPPAAEKKEETPSLEKASSADAGEYRNWFDVSVGGNLVRGDKGAFQQRHQLPASAYGGVEDFHYEQDVGKKGLFQIDGRGIFDNEDYSLRLSLEHPDIGYLRGGVREYRNYYDGSGGFLPLNGAWFDLYNDELDVNRGDVFFEGGLTLPGKPIFKFRYDHIWREGQKNSTSWGDTGRGLTGGAIRNIVPTFLDIDEKRDIFSVDAEHTISETHFGVGLRYENSDQNDSRNIHRRPGEAADRYLTQRDIVETDLFNVHAFQETWLRENILFTTGYSFTTMDTDVAGSRVYGADYDPIYDPGFARRQQFDEGFLNLSGGSRVDQHVMNLNFMFMPFDNLTIVPSLRAEKQDQNGIANFTETNVGARPALVSTQDPIENLRERGFTDVTEGLEVRYTGLTNWVVYARGEWLEGDGDLRERELDLLEGATTIFRDTDSSRFTQKYATGFNYYPLRQLNLAAQYYYKSRKNDYDHREDSTSNLPTSPDRYPAYIVDQNFDTHDVNFRVTVRPFSNLTLVSRYDFQVSTVDSRMDFLAKQQSADITSHIFSESVTWVPIAKLYLQGSMTYGIDHAWTPAVAQLPGIIQRSDNDYVDGSFTAGYALTPKDDIQAQYFIYYANNYQDNSALSVPYNASGEEHGITGTLIHRFSRAMEATLKYGWFTSMDKTSGGHNNYEAHMIYSSYRYRF